jgi:uncharacterized protein (DUF1810 family)
MRYGLTVAVISVVTVNIVLSADPPDRMAARKEAWQKALDHEKFHFSESTIGVVYSLSQYRADCKVCMVYDPKLSAGLTFKFERDGKELVKIVGHAESAFRTDGNVLYFARFPTGDTGCTVFAYDLTTGKKVWEAKLSALGPVSHFAYRNQVTMELSSFAELGKEGEGAIKIVGRESYGDYIEVLDRATGKVLAHKIYRQGF